jgi:glycosyltransferase involved in cell wall biosynthesis
MRLVIDLHATQTREPEDSRSAVALTRAIVRLAGLNEVWLAMSDRPPESVDRLRAQLRGVVPSQRVVVYQTPLIGTSDATLWKGRSAALIRQHFLEGLLPDLVLVLDALSSPVVSKNFRSDMLLQAFQTPIAGEVNVQLGVVHGTLENTPIQQNTMDGAVFVVETGNAPNEGDALQDATRFWQLASDAVASRVACTSPKFPRLAYVSPLPPERSGIADYSAELIPELARFYEIDVVVDQEAVETSWIQENVPVRSVSWFKEHAKEFDRILYHVGNSPAHKHIFDLVQDHPGIVVLHDFFLANVINHLDHTGYTKDGFLRALYASHGWSAILAHSAGHANDAVWRYPCNMGILGQADGVIVHSDHARQMADQWYGPEFSQQWRVLPLLRGMAAQADRVSARASLGLGPSDFLICSFGMLGPTKRNIDLLKAWMASPLAKDRFCRLVFVGENDGNNYGKELLQAISRSGCEGRISITGYVSHPEYCTYLAACDGAVQLRGQSRGETSAAVLDCLLHGIPTIANGHGAIAELPDNVLIKLDDEFNGEQLAGALAQLRSEPALRERLSREARAYVALEHAPRKVGDGYHEAIERLMVTSSKRNYLRLVRAMGRIACAAPPSNDDFVQAANAIAANLPRPGPSQLLVDVSAMVQTDLKTGIQRVVRSIVNALLASPPAGFRVEPVYSAGRGEPYRYARHYMQKMLGMRIDTLVDAPIEIASGDQFLGLDLFLHGTQQNQVQLQDLRNRGVEIYFVVFDVLPIQRPDCFPTGTEQDFAAWLDTIAMVADGLVCISRSVADDLYACLARTPPPRTTDLGIGFFHLGADIEASTPTLGMEPDAPLLFEALNDRPSFLMVGTLEPRKGHAQALAAFDLLWGQGIDVNLVIVGKNGWMVDSLVERIAKHPERGLRLHWLPSISDEMLERVYASATALLAASEGEGFGLPLIEAAQHGVPIVARNLPVFVEVMGDNASYFDGCNASDLASAVEAWLLLHRDGRAPDSRGIHWLTWEQSAAQLIRTITLSEWRHSLPGTCNT